MAPERALSGDTASGHFDAILNRDPRGRGVESFAPADLCAYWRRPSRRTAISAASGHRIEKTTQPRLQRDLDRETATKEKVNSDPASTAKWEIVAVLYFETTKRRPRKTNTCATPHADVITELSKIRGLNTFFSRPTVMAFRDNL